MHEMGIAMEVLRIAEEEARAAGAGRVLGLKLRVGRWSGVEPEALRFSLDALTEGTLLEGCRVELVSVEPEFACSDCGGRFRAEGHRDPCPVCSGAGVLVAGDEFTLAQLEVDDP